MSELSGPIPSVAKRNLSLVFTLFSSLSLMALLLVGRPVQAEAPDEAYVSIYSRIQEAESLESSGKNASALTNYQAAAIALKAFQRKFPDWNSRMVAGRLNRLTEKLNALAQAPATSMQARTDGSNATRGSSASAASAEGNVKLLQAGAEPRTVLRLHPKAGDKQSLEMSVQMNVETKLAAMEIPAMKLPSIKMAIDLEIKDVSAQGDITYNATVGEPTLGSDADAASPVTQMLKASFGGAKGATGTGTVSDRGISKSMEVKLGDASGAQRRQAVDQVKETVTGALLVLPEEAIGVGAKWEVRRTSQMQGLSFNQTETYELVAVDGDKLTLKLALAQSPGSQKTMTPPAGAAGLPMELTKLAGKGEGELTCHLGQLMPVEGTSKDHLELTLSSKGPQRQSMTQKMDMDIRLQAK